MISKRLLNTYKNARMSRDARFDGEFFMGVKTTGIFCRSVCPAAPAPKEINITYFKSAIAAHNAGFRPCLRCRPDSAPGSSAWVGTDKTVNRAIQLINEGGLQDASVSLLAEKLGVSDRYLRKLFTEKIGAPPKQYALFRQCLFAKQLLHDSSLSITDIAYASGFNSVRRFNDCFKNIIQLTPSQVKRQNLSPKSKKPTIGIQLKLYYRPPYNWEAMQAFYQKRIIQGLDWCSNSSYGRTFCIPNIEGDITGSFTAEHINNNDALKGNYFNVTIDTQELSKLRIIVTGIRRLLDLDCDSTLIDKQLRKSLGKDFPYKKGIRIPGLWNEFEACTRAVLGQQISITAANKLAEKLVIQLGDKITDDKILFPSCNSIASSSLSFLGIPEKRKQTLHDLASFFIHINDEVNWDNCLAIKGIGPWTINYAQMRGSSSPDIFLESDLIIKKMLLTLKKTSFEDAAPWRSYLTYQLWSQY